MAESIVDALMERLERIEKKIDELASNIARLKDRSRGYDYNVATAESEKSYADYEKQYREYVERLDLSAPEGSLADNLERVNMTNAKRDKTSASGVFKNLDKIENRIQKP